jgi:hypothetical protein
VSCRHNDDCWGRLRLVDLACVNCGVCFWCSSLRVIMPVVRSCVEPCARRLTNPFSTGFTIY